MIFTVIHNHSVEYWYINYNSISTSIKSKTFDALLILLIQDEFTGLLNVNTLYLFLLFSFFPEEKNKVTFMSFGKCWSMVIKIYSENKQTRNKLFRSVENNFVNFMGKLQLLYHIKTCATIEWVQMVIFTGYCFCVMLVTSFYCKISYLYFLC